MLKKFIKNSVTPKSRNAEPLEKSNTEKPPKYNLGMTQKLNTDLANKLKLVDKDSFVSPGSSRNNPIHIERNATFQRAPLTNPSANLIYDLKVENKKLREQNESLQERLSDMFQTLQMNKQMLKDVIDKSNIDIKNKTDQFIKECEQKDKVIEDLRTNFIDHMNALVFICTRCGHKQYKTEMGKTGLDKTRFQTNTNFEDSKGAISSVHGSQGAQNHFETFLNWTASGKAPKEVTVSKANDEIKENQEGEVSEDNSPKTFRMVVSDTPEGYGNDKSTPIEDICNGSVVIKDVTPSKLEFKSDLEEEVYESSQRYTNEENYFEFDPNMLYTHSPLEKDSIAQDLEKKESGQKNLNVSDFEDY
ncbi:unnamed protein product [Moneuplotes crassus]|uniref:Uncharacterized protein n=1 Tax=Euplotes crassus TaxID=5936 RepID=A0AAD1ULR2_EUPCR|nr:unnamed protein product [Moneuplotes crassus]